MKTWELEKPHVFPEMEVTKRTDVGAMGCPG